PPSFPDAPLCGCGSGDGPASTVPRLSLPACRDPSTTPPPAAAGRWPRACAPATGRRGCPAHWRRGPAIRPAGCGSASPAALPGRRRAAAATAPPAAAPASHGTASPPSPRAGNRPAGGRACPSPAAPPAAVAATATGRCTAASRRPRCPATARACGTRAGSQAPAQVTLGEGPADVDAALETHGLEALAHLARQHQPLDLVVTLVALDRVGNRLDLGQALGQAAVDQEAGLGAVAGQVETGADARFRQGGEVDEGGDVGQARQVEGIAVGAVAVVADQGAVAALGQVVLAARIAVVDEDHGAVVQQAADRLDPVGQLRQQLAAVTVRQRRAQVLFDVADG